MRKIRVLLTMVLLFVALFIVVPVQAAASDPKVTIEDGTDWPSTLICTARPGTPCNNMAFTANHIIGFNLQREDNGAFDQGDLIIGHQSSDWTSLGWSVGYTGSAPSCTFTNNSTRVELSCDGSNNITAMFISGTVNDNKSDNGFGITTFTNPPKANFSWAS